MKCTFARSDAANRLGRETLCHTLKIHFLLLELDDSVCVHQRLVHLHSFSLFFVHFHIHNSALENPSIVHQ